GWDLWIYRVGEPKPQPVLHSAADELGGTFSPNGRYLAYLSNESGRAEVYVQPFPPTGAKWQISTSGASVAPRWSRDGRELHYSAFGEVLVVPVETTGSFAKGAARTLFRSDILPPGSCWFNWMVLSARRASRRSP